MSSMCEVSLQDHDRSLTRRNFPYLTPSSRGVSGPVAVVFGKLSDMAQCRHMNQTLRVNSWNCGGASRRSGLWDYLLDLDHDVAVLQDFRTAPEHLLQLYSHVQCPAVTTTDRAPPYFTGILVKGTSTGDIPLPARNG